jgi:S1-C subfamily serine protease
MEWESYVVKIIVKSKDIDLNHPLNTFNTGESSGTGFFIEKNIILTNYHVIKYAFNIEVIYKQNNIIQAKVQHIFPDDDLALIILEKTVDDCNILEFKVITTKQIGTVHTIGFPLGSTNIKVTQGIISGFQGSLIQTDAPINPGNSGGPLVIKENDKYFLIGVNVSKMSGQAEGTGYVVPIYRFMILKDIIKNSNEIAICKPLMLFDFQKLIQDNLKAKLFKNHMELQKSNFGVRITRLNPKYYLNKYIKMKDVIISINSKQVDMFGTVKFDFYPEKIPLKELGLWFVAGDNISIEILDPSTQEIRKVSFPLEIIKTNYPEYYALENYPSYFVENNGLILSVITKEHIRNFKDLNISNRSDISQVLINRSNENDILTIYLADLNYNKLGKFIKYPIGEVIVEINDKQFHTYEEFIQICSEPITKIKTFSEKIYYIDNVSKVEEPILPKQIDKPNETNTGVLNKVAKIMSTPELVKHMNRTQYAINYLQF